MVFGVGISLRICLRHRYAGCQESIRPAKPPASSRLGAQVNQTLQVIPYQSLDESHLWSNLGRSLCMAFRSALVSRSAVEKARPLAIINLKMRVISGLMLRARSGPFQDSDGNLRRSRSHLSCLRPDLKQDSIRDANEIRETLFLGQLNLIPERDPERVP